MCVKIQLICLIAWIIVTVPSPQRHCFYVHRADFFLLFRKIILMKILLLCTLVKISLRVISMMVCVMIFISIALITAQKFEIFCKTKKIKLTFLFVNLKSIFYASIDRIDWVNSSFKRFFHRLIVIFYVFLYSFACVKNFVSDLMCKRGVSFLWRAFVRAFRHHKSFTIFDFVLMKKRKFHRFCLEKIYFIIFHRVFAVLF